MKFRTGTLYTQNMAHLYGRTTSSSCLLCQQPDSQIHLLSGCQHTTFLTLSLAGKVACSWRLCMQILLLVLLTEIAGLREFIEACEGLRASDRHYNCVKAATPLPLRDFVVNLLERLRAVWN